MVLIIIIALLLFAGVYVLYTYNNLIKTRNLVDEAFATMDVYLKKRWNLIPNLIDIVKEYSNYEKETLQDVIKLRNEEYDDLTMTRKLSLNYGISKKIKKLMAVSEVYPELNSNENYKKLIEELIQVENEIEYSRKYYNGIIMIINNKILTFPSNIVAKLFKIKKLSMFEITQDEKNL